MTSFKALIAEDTDGKPSTRITELTLDQLPEHDVLVKVDYSTINYKDALAVTGKSRICQSLPMVCGIDLAGSVVESTSEQWQAGDKVLVNGFGLSETHWGGYAEYQSLKPEWLVKTPAAFTAKDCMAIGTAGYTAMLCVMALEEGGITPDSGTVLVTGASGGVGSFSVSLLSRLGFRVAAATGSESEHEWLRALGAAEIIDRSFLSGDAKPLDKQNWAAAIDSVGGSTLATVISQTQYSGVVAACGLAGGIGLPSSVMPFILRNVRLQGVDSVHAPQARRQIAWERLAQLLTPSDLTALYEVAALDDVPTLAAQLLAGNLSKRRVIKVSA